MPQTRPRGVLGISFGSIKIEDGGVPSFPPTARGQAPREQTPARPKKSLLSMFRRKSGPESEDAAAPAPARSAQPADETDRQARKAQKQEEKARRKAERQAEKQAAREAMRASAAARAAEGQRREADAPEDLPGPAPESMRRPYPELRKPISAKRSRPDPFPELRKPPEQRRPRPEPFPELRKPNLEKEQLREQESAAEAQESPGSGNVPEPEAAEAAESATSADSEEKRGGGWLSGLLSSAERSAGEAQSGPLPWLAGEDEEEATGPAEAAGDARPHPSETQSGAVETEAAEAFDPHADEQPVPELRADDGAARDLRPEEQTPAAAEPQAEPSAPDLDREEAAGARPEEDWRPNDDYRRRTAEALAQAAMLDEGVEPGDGGVERPEQAYAVDEETEPSQQADLSPETAPSGETDPHEDESRDDPLPPEPEEEFPAAAAVEPAPPVQDSPAARTVRDNDTELPYVRPARTRRTAARRRLDPASQLELELPADRAAAREEKRQNTEAPPAGAQADRPDGPAETATPQTKDDEAPAPQLRYTDGYDHDRTQHAAELREPPQEPYTPAPRFRHTDGNESFPQPARREGYAAPDPFGYDARDGEEPGPPTPETGDGPGPLTGDPFAPVPDAPAGDPHTPGESGTGDPFAHGMPPSRQEEYIPAPEDGEQGDKAGEAPAPSPYADLLDPSYQPRRGFMDLGRRSILFPTDDEEDEEGTQDGGPDEAEDFAGSAWADAPGSASADLPPESGARYSDFERMPDGGGPRDTAAQAETAGDDAFPEERLSFRSANGDAAGQHADESPAGEHRPPGQFISGEDDDEDSEDEAPAFVAPEPTGRPDEAAALMRSIAHMDTEYYLPPPKAPGMILLGVAGAAAGAMLANFIYGMMGDVILPRFMAILIGVQIFGGLGAFAGNFLVIPLGGQRRRSSQGALPPEPEEWFEEEWDGADDHLDRGPFVEVPRAGGMEPVAAGGQLSPRDSMRPAAPE